MGKTNLTSHTLFTIIPEYGIFKIGKYYMIDSEGLQKAVYNPKYNLIVASYAISYAGSIILTDSVKVDLKTKKVEKYEETLGSLFYFKDIDTIVPKSQIITEGSYESSEVEGREIKLGGDKQQNTSLKGEDFIKKYYSLLGEKKLNDVYNITSWSNGNKTFDTFNSWYKDINKVNLIDIESLGNDEYKITVDIYENIVNQGTKQDKFHPFDKGGYYLEGIELYTRYITNKKIIKKDGVQKLETVKNLNTYYLPHIKTINNHNNQEEFDIFANYNASNEFIEKSIGNGKTLSFGDCAPHDSSYTIIIHGKEGDINNYYSWTGDFGKELKKLIGIKENDFRDTEIEKITKLFNNAPLDMLNNVLY